MRANYVFIALLLGTAFARALDKPIVYDHITKDGASVDQAVNAALAAKYTIVPVEDSPAYVNVKLAAGAMPRVAATDSGEKLKGYVLVAYVISADGRATDPVVLKSTDERLNSIATKAMDGWRFIPAKLNGAPIATTAAQEFNFKGDVLPTNVPSKGFATANIVLYQANEILERRLPGTEQLAAYIKKLQAILGDYFADATTPETLHTVVGLRPGKIVRVWFVSSKPSANTQDFDALRKKLESVDPVDVQGGPIVFAITGALAGGEAASTQDEKDFHPPMPKEWQDASANLNPTIPMPDDYLNAVWPDKK